MEGFYTADKIDFKDGSIRETISERLPIGQRIRVHSLTISGAIYDQDATVKGYTDDAQMLVRFDTLKF